MRHSYKAEGSKLFLAKKTADILDQSVTTALSLHSELNERQYLRDTFSFFERSKSGILLDALSEAKAKSFSYLPDSLIEQENQIRVSLAGYESLVAQERSKGGNIDSTKLIPWQAKLFEFNRQYEELINAFETHYPNYYDLKYNTVTSSVEDVQKFLTDNTDTESTLISYFLGKDFLYAFSVTPDSFFVTTTPRKGSLEVQIDSLREGITGRDYALYTKFASLLYQQLVAPLADHLSGEQLIIIPHGVLSYVPFEALLTQPIDQSTDNRNYQTLPYLVNEYAISYTYSATLLLQTQQQELNPPSRDLLAFAPVFPDGIPAAQHSGQFIKEVLAADSTLTIRYGEGALPHTRDEVNSLKRLFDQQHNFIARFLNSQSRTYVENQARESQLKKEDTANYRYVHLATHGYASADIPQLSRLLFTLEDSTASEDGLLHLSEIYNLKLNAELVVLSACETGLGQLAEGEGIIGLSRGFFYAGAQNLAVSLWRAPDEETKNLMVNFYSSMLSGQSKTRSLQLAKATMIDLSPEFAAPYYWAGFVLIGA